jgi:two-component system, NarL family, invasion response regulator UvrY
MYSVLIVDECPILRYGVKQILKDEIGRLFVGESSSSTPTLAPAGERNWDVVILGSCQDARELNLIRETKRTLPTARILVINGKSGHQAALQAMHAGASGLVTKNTSLAEFVRAFRDVLAGTNYISEQPLLASGDSLPHTKLSKREYVVLAAIAAGKRTSDIALELKLDARTISTYRKRVLGKMEMNSNAELIRYAAEHGLR